MKEKKQVKKPPTPRAEKIFRLTAVCVPLLALLGLWFAYYQMQRLEAGILDVCATQQDAYVSLVLEQINLNQNQEEQVIVDILETLDASSNKYWTFSTEQTMLFVKDVLETNKYKGFTAATYYTSDSAAEFFDQLKLNDVTHANIQIDGQGYIASGTAFSYRGGVYKICLLANSAVILDSNRFLGAKTELWTMFIAVLGLLVVVPLGLALELRRMQARRQTDEQVIKSLNRNLVDMNERFAQKDRPEPVKLWPEAALGEFVEKLQSKGSTKATFMRIKCAAQEGRERFLAAAQSLDKRALRFALGESDLILLFIETDYDAAFLSVIPLLSADATIQNVKIADADNGLSLEAAAREILKTV